MATKAQLLAALAPFAAAGQRCPPRDKTPDDHVIVAMGNGSDPAVVTYGDLRRAAEVVGKVKP